MHSAANNFTYKARALAVATRCIIVLAGTVLVPLSVTGQAPPDPNYQRQQVFPSYQAFKDELTAIAATTDATQRQTRLNTLWTNLRSGGQVPYAQDNKYALLYRGSASSVAF